MSLSLSLSLVYFFSLHISLLSFIFYFKNGMKTLHVTGREEWREWLETNHKKEKEIWLIYYKKHTCEPRIPYDDAVEEAICYGWIDSIIKRIDENTYCQKFTPRSRNSKWSEMNIRRAEKMISNGRMSSHGMGLFEQTKKDPSLILKTEKTPSIVEIPEDLDNKLHNTGKAFRYFISFPKSYRMMCIRWINAAKKDETRKHRITEVAEKASKGEKIGLK
ncbi:MAG TPA: hypothetical protein DEQ09_10265 [Bacteroidales bacterium]|nr:hypothetical protein [Bacteroidales bacterium]